MRTTEGKVPPTVPKVIVTGEQSDSNGVQSVNNVARSVAQRQVKVAATGFKVRVTLQKVLRHSGNK